MRRHGVPLLQLLIHPLGQKPPHPRRQLDNYYLNAVSERKGILESDGIIEVPERIIMRTMPQVEMEPSCIEQAAS